MTRARRSFAALMTAEAISVFGSRMTFVAVPWLVLVTTGSATRTGVAAFAEMLPYVLVSAAGGPWVDRFGAARVSVVMDAASVVVVAGVPLLYRSGGLSFAVLVGLVAVAGTLRGFGDSGKRVLFPAAVRAGGIAMARATGVHDGLSRGAILLGAPLAGVLISATDAPTVLLFDAATFGIGAVVVATLVRVNVTTEEAPADPQRSYLGQLRDGLAFVRRDRLLLGIAVMVFVTNLLDQANSTVFVPVWAKEIFGSPVGIGVTSASFAAGAIVGNIGFTFVAKRIRRYPVYAFGFLLAGAPRYVALAFNAPLWTIVMIGFVGGMAIAAVNPILSAVSYERIPPPLVARVFGLSIALSFAGIPLGSLLGGLAADHLGARNALLLAGAAYFVATLMPFLSPVWREMDQPAKPAVVPKQAVEADLTSDPAGH
jgi:hypothetical protein